MMNLRRRFRCVSYSLTEPALLWAVNYEQGTLGEREAYDIIDKEGKHSKATGEMKADPSEPCIHRRLNLAALCGWGY